MGEAQTRPSAFSIGTISCGESMAFLTERRGVAFWGGYEVCVRTQDSDIIIPIAVTPRGGRTIYGIVSHGIWKRTVSATLVAVDGAFSVFNLANGESVSARAE